MFVASCCKGFSYRRQSMQIFLRFIGYFTAFFATILYSAFADAPEVSLGEPISFETVAVEPGYELLSIKRGESSTFEVLSRHRPRPYKQIITLPKSANPAEQVEHVQFYGYLVQFADEPLAKSYLAIKNKSVNERSALLENVQRGLNRKQSILEGKLKSRSSQARVRHTYAMAFAGAAVDGVSQSDLSDLRQDGTIINYWPNYRVEPVLENSVSLTKAKLAWANGYIGSGIRIGVIDTGIDVSHPMFGGCSVTQYLAGQCQKVAIGYDFVDNDLVPQDCHGHGTHVASTAAGDGEVVGVAYGATIVPYRVLNCSGFGDTAGVILAIERSMDPNQDNNPADHLEVINLSLGSPGNPDDPISQAIDNAAQVGVIPVVAAGNSGNRETIRSPGTARSAITVGAAVDPNSIAGFSSKGPVRWTPVNTSGFSTLMKPDLSAPGVSICAAKASGTQLGAICNAASDRISISGTSMATPHVAGAAALLREINPSWTVGQIKAALKASADPMINAASGSPLPPQSQGAGFLNIQDAIAIQDPIEVKLRPILISAAVITISADINTSRKVDYSLEIAPTPEFQAMGSWSVIASNTLAPGTHLINEPFDLTTINDGSYAVRLRVFDSSGYEFVDYGTIELQSGYVVSPEIYETINQYDPLEVELEIAPGFDTDALRFEFACDENSPYNAIQAQVDITDPLHPKGIIPGGAFGSCIHGLLRAISTHNSVDHAYLLPLRVEPTLRSGSPIKFKWTKLSLPFGEVTFNPGGTPLSANVLGNSDEELIAIRGSYEDLGQPADLLIYSHQGNLLQQIVLSGQNLNVSEPLGYRGGFYSVSPLLIDLDRDGKADILFPVEGVGQFSNNYLVAMRGDGTLLDGWPVAFSSNISSLSASDTDNNGRPEILVGLDSGLTTKILDYSGNLVRTFSHGNSSCSGVNLLCLFSWQPPSSPLLIRHTDIQEPLLVSYNTSISCAPNSCNISSIQKTIDVDKLDGSVFSSWAVPQGLAPLANTYYSPIAANIYGTSQPEIIIPLDSFSESQSLGIQAYDLLGNSIPGWPALATTGMYGHDSSLAAIDLDRDGYPEILDNLTLNFTPTAIEFFGMYAVDHQGGVVNGWPQFPNQCLNESGWLGGNPGVVGALLTSGATAVVGSTGSCVVGYKADGAELSTFPRRPAPYHLPTHISQLSDVDRDDQLELISVNGSASLISGYPDRFTRLYVWDTELNAPPRSERWLGIRKDKYYSAVYGQEPQELFSIRGRVSYFGQGVQGVVVEALGLGQAVTDANGNYRIEYGQLGQNYLVYAHLPPGGKNALKLLNSFLPQWFLGLFIPPISVVHIDQEEKRNFILW